MPSVLLIEDEPELREALQEYLELSGFEVWGVGSGAEALERAERDRPDLVLCDLSLPDRRGDAVLVELRRRHAGSRLYVHSGDASYRPGPELTACGLAPADVFTKPVDLSDLVRRFRQDLAT